MAPTEPTRVRISLHGASHEPPLLRLGPVVATWRFRMATLAAVALVLAALVGGALERAFQSDLVTVLAFTLARALLASWGLLPEVEVLPALGRQSRAPRGSVEPPSRDSAPER